MSLLVALLLAAPIDGHQLLARARASKNNKSYYAYVHMLKNDILEEAMLVSDQGDTSLSYCVKDDKRRGLKTFEEVRKDLDKLFYRIGGLAFKNSAINNACFVIDWSPY